MTWLPERYNFLCLLPSPSPPARDSSDMVSTVTLNPMLDKTIYVSEFRLGEITRATRRDMVPGGKGINVARQLTRFGVEAVATGFLGGEIGKIVERLLDEERVKHEFVHVQDCTREGYTIFEESTGRTTGVFEPGHEVSLDEMTLLEKKCEHLIQKSEWMILSGSTPTRNLDFFYRKIIGATEGLPCRVVLDSYGPALRNGLEAKPFMIKPNVKEFEHTFGTALSSESTILGQLSWLEKSGVSMIVLTDTEKPFYASYLGKRWRITPPSVDTVNSVGSGDAFVAGIVYGFSKNWKIERTLQFATAAGAVNASRWAVVDVSLSEAETLSARVQVREV